MTAAWPSMRLCIRRADFGLREIEVQSRYMDSHPCDWSERRPQPSWNSSLGRFQIPNAASRGGRLFHSYAAHPHPFLNCGDRARVTRGPLSGVVGVLTRCKGNHRLVLSVEIDASHAEREVPARILNPVPGHSMEPAWPLRESNGRL
jgi:hypothetical protein